MRIPRVAALVSLAGLLSLAARADWNSTREAFQRGMADPVAENRVQTVRQLAGIDHPDGMTMLLDAYEAEEDTDVRHALADAINAVENVPARDVFRFRVLKHPDPQQRARFCAVFADERMRDRVDMLRQLMRDSAGVVRARVCRNLCERDSFLVLDTARLLADPEVEVRMAAAQGLAVVKSRESIPALIDALEAEKNREVRWGIADTLSKVTGAEMSEDVAVWRSWWSEHRADGLGPVEKALARASEWLKPVLKRALESDALARGGGGGGGVGNVMVRNSNSGISLMIYALWHAGVPASDPVMSEALDWLDAFHPSMTYESAIAAMAMADISAVRYRDQLVEIGQFLCDTQCSNGQWSYGNWMGAPATRSKPPKKNTDSGGRKPEPGDTQAQAKKVPLANRTVTRSPNGDNSNTQYGILGLRAAASVCEVPDACWQRSLEWFAKTQGKDGSWGYGVSGVNMGYESMTVCGLASIAICMRELGPAQGKGGQPLETPAVKKALAWMDQGWETMHAAGIGGRNYYCIYGIERAGILLGIEKFGAHDWYEEGKKWLVENQLPNGEWGMGVGMSTGQGHDTSFAILFLKRATKGYTVSGPDTGNK